ncbi:unnamed protein product, partial [Adineta steineri]
TPIRGTRPTTTPMTTTTEKTSTIV